MKTMNQNTWIAVAVAVFVVAYFLFGGSVVNLFNNDGGTNDQAMAIQNATPSPGFQMQDVVLGTGETASEGALLTVHYVGSLTDGQVFDNSITRKDPFQFVLGAQQVIPGWDIGFNGMKVGGKRRLVIPPALAYGEKGYGPIPANATLIFDVELLKVETPPQAIQSNQVY